MIQGRRLTNYVFDSGKGVTFTAIPGSVEILRNIYPRGTKIKAART
jgi:hypothetical protein